jgi:hypothetical protein
MPHKQVIALGTYHNAQLHGHALNSRLAGAIALIREKYGMQIILEEWWDSQESFAATLVTMELEWENIGTPITEDFETFRDGLNCHPPTHDPREPILPEYGPLEAQERREGYMVERVKEFMEPHQVGLLIIGLAHLHSVLSKLKSIGFDVRGYSWLEQA